MSRGRIVFIVFLWVPVIVMGVMMVLFLYSVYDLPMLLKTLGLLLGPIVFIGLTTFFIWRWMDGFRS